jgi:hypothetical protein
MNKQNKRKKGRLKREAAEQDQRRDQRYELFETKMRRQNMAFAFGFGAILAMFLYVAWFQICCKFSLDNPEEIEYFKMISSLFFFIIGWITADDFDRKRGLANFSFIGGFILFTLPYVFLQITACQTAEITRTITISCLCGAVLSLIYHWLKAAICSLYKCFSRSPSP